jgi:hypothetical protein
MNRIAFVARCCFLMMQIAAVLPAFGQTCANPTALVSAGSLTGNTCTSTNQLPYIANGAISAGGNQDVYYIHTANGHSVLLTVQPDPSVDMGLFVCRNQCSTYATCVAALDPGVSGTTTTATLPDGPGDYYVIVGTASAASCGSYTLSLIPPLND